MMMLARHLVFETLILNLYPGDETDKRHEVGEKFNEKTKICFRFLSTSLTISASHLQYKDCPSLFKSY